MAKINAGRVILCGLLAGLVINIGESVLNGVLLVKDWDAAMQALNKPSIGGQAIACFIVLGFLLGIGAVWVYAAIRPRFGEGPKTAICAGLIVWAFAYLYPSVGQFPTGIFPANLLVIGTVWGFFEVPIGTLLGAWLYKE